MKSHQTGSQSGFLIGRHEGGQSAKKSKRGLRHASEANRNQLRDSAVVRLVQKLDWIAPILGWLSASMRGAPFVRGDVPEGKGGVVY
jgi:hypothetical protein